MTPYLLTKYHCLLHPFQAKWWNKWTTRMSLCRV